MKKKELKVSFYLRSNYSKSGKSPVMIRVNYDGEVLPLGSAGISATPSKWKGGFVGRSEEAVKGRMICDDIKKSIQALFEEWYPRQTMFCLKNFREHYKAKLCDSSKSSSKNFSEVISSWMEFQEERREAGVIRSNTCRTRRSLVKIILRYVEENDVKLEYLDKEYVNRLEIGLLRLNLTANTVNTCVNILRSVCNYAIEQKWMTMYPLKGVQRLKTTAVIRYLTIEELRALLAVRAKGKTKVVKDIFEFMTLTSLAYSDVFRLSPAHLHKDNNQITIRIRRQKTSVECVIPLLQRASEILDKYRKNKEDDREEIFPYFKLMEFNTRLNILAKEAGLNKKLTSHMARHTFGSIAVSNGVHLKAVQKCMGHKSITTTERYSSMQTSALQQEINKLEVIQL
ncbi:MAG: tyrosine-type recombinase/integrase [Porphyromonas sp.]|nr:tyrosine-type recombinase/integrase [Porphyromonas sp.]